MKKAKVMLTAIVVFAAIGTGLAFKVISTDKVYIDTNSDGLSDTFVTGYVLTDSGTPGADPAHATNALFAPTVSTFVLFTGN